MVVGQDSLERKVSPRTELPTLVDELDLAWLQAVLRQPDGRGVRNAEVQRIIWGTATKVFVAIEWEDSQTSHVCIKGAFDPALREYLDVGLACLLESVFYRHIAPGVGIRLPRCFYAHQDGSSGVVVLEDLARLGCSFTPPGGDLSLDEVEQTLTQLATLHAATWGWKALQVPLLRVGSKSMRKGMAAMGGEGRWEALTTRPVVEAFLPERYRNQGTVMSAMDRLWSEDDRRADLVVCHGDAHTGQLYFTLEGHVGLLDWQSVALMPPIKDVAYFIGGALSVADRRKYERDLLDVYRACLSSAGAPSLDPEEAWLDYRRQMLQGLIWPLVTEQMQPAEVIAKMNERYLTALDDLKSLEALKL